MMTLCSDSAGEYVEKDYEDYLKSNGIHQLLTVPRTPDQTLCQRDETGH